MDELYDVVVIGAGPAGLSAAIYAARAKYRVLVVEKEKIGGQITITSEIVNYPGIGKTDGKRLTEDMRKQAESFGAEFLMAEVTDIDLTGDIRIVKSSKGDIRTLGIVLALGANPRKLGFEGEREFQGRGVAYCATCDGEFFTGLDVFVIGGGFAAAEEAVFLTKYAKKVTIIVREEDFTCAKTVADKAKDHEKIEVHYETEIIRAEGQGLLKKAVFRNNKTGGEWSYEAPEGKTFGIFVFAGYVPDTGWVKGKVELDKQGYIVIDMDRKTDIPGVYAAGDVCVKNLRQVVTAVSDGAAAATSLERYVSHMYEKLGISEAERDTAKAGAGGGLDQAASTDTVSDNTAPDHGELITSEMKAQLVDLFARFENKVVVKAFLDDSQAAGEMEQFVRELGVVPDKVECLVIHEGDGETETLGDESVKNVSLEGMNGEMETVLPFLSIYRADGRETGIRFYAVPGGHEFNSFVIALYNTAGPGQKLEEAEEKRIEAIKKPVNIKIAVSLSCTMCPATVMAAGRIAAENTNVEAWTYDLAHHPELREKYQIMSVPCMIINDSRVEFGKKSVAELLDILEKELRQEQEREAVYGLS